MLWKGRNGALEADLRPYTTVSSPSEIEWIEKRSRFIGRCWPVEDEAQALAILERVKKDCWDATHNCYAYALKNGVARYSDDGEPSKTAGLPMMEGVKHIGVTDLLVIVTRYFGGILLGAGGLVRAYSKVACDAIRAAGLVRMLPCRSFSLCVPYPYWNTVKSICEQYGRIGETAFVQDVRCTVWVQETSADAFCRALTDRTEGRISAEPIGCDRFPFPIPED